MKKKLLFLVSIGLIVSLLSACSEGGSAGSAENESYELQMSVTVTETSTWYEAAEKLAQDLEDETDGRITMEVYPNEGLSNGDSGQAVELLSRGNIDLTFNSTIIYSILDDRFGVASAPFLFRDLEEVDKVFNGEGGEAINEVLRDIGVEPLGFGQNGFRQVTNSAHPIKSPGDIDGLDIRIPGITMYTDLWRELGANPSTMTFSEVFTSLQQGAIDGQENPIDVIHSSKLEEVQDYITMWNYSYDPLVLGINKELYDSMSEEDQELISRLGAEAADYQVELAREKEAEQIEELKDAGMQFYYPTDEELDAFQEAVQPIYDEYEDIWGSDLLEAFTP
ncbi:DctP family TRAP transporter solute-binding subunit [Tenuibacillus multivorans]|uniref:Tripartite ATP-independent transporter solute receptor, DctP family n=1 Tax=Tenuibacillus multivorans TaxID=237069 RepID=A0A1H0BYV0_9BACI|nr:DctP family TRAP transporter solute-binding subunit [Tenuibacillus multivorans]GEL78578.1 exported protein [Tenuibacillus multivorans]SDN50888.1 tripartite ATP-independent transporter solute receptor, DctP family [Tenuibacillus multivorans]